MTAQDTPQDYSTRFTVSQTPQQVFDAINNVRHWWTGEIAGDSHHVGDEFSYRYEPYHDTRQRVVELVPGRRVAWLVTQGSIHFVTDKNEWTGTRIVFDIAHQDGQTELRFTHEGLTPAIACYDNCSAGWAAFIDKCLKDYIVTDKPQVHHF